MSLISIFYCESVVQFGFKLEVYEAVAQNHQLMEILICSWCNLSVSVTATAFFVTKRKFCVVPNKFLHRTLEC